LASVPRKLKEPREYPEQIRILREEHGLLIGDDEYAIDVLSRVNYYRFCAYGLSLVGPKDKEKFIPGTTFEEIHALYRFDSRLRNLLLALLEPFEIELRTKVAYHLAINYGAESYKDPALFRETRNREGTLVHTSINDRFKKAVEKESNKLFVRHHNEEYEGRFPVWVAVELFTFGMISQLFAIMKPKDQKIVARQFGLQNPNILDTWSHAFSSLRNRCAHNDRIYNAALPQLPSLLREDKIHLIKPENRVFTVILALKRITSDANLWEWFYHELFCLMTVHPEINLPCIGFPNNWQKVLAP
jgi:abortive infection bacteriophage resistance protein